MADLEHTLTAGGVCTGVCWGGRLPPADTVPTTTTDSQAQQDFLLPQSLEPESAGREYHGGRSHGGFPQRDAGAIPPAASCASRAPNAPAATDITGASSCLTTSPPSADPPGAQVSLHVRLHLEILPRSWAMGRQAAQECRRGGLVGLIIGVVHGACLPAPLPSLRDLNHR